MRKILSIRITSRVYVLQHWKAPKKASQTYHHHFNSVKSHSLNGLFRYTTWEYSIDLVLSFLTANSSAEPVSHHFSKQDYKPFNEIFISHVAIVYVLSTDLGLWSFLSTMGWINKTISFQPGVNRHYSLGKIWKLQIRSKVIKNPL